MTVTCTNIDRFSSMDADHSRMAPSAQRVSKRSVTIESPDTMPIAKDEFVECIRRRLREADELRFPNVRFTPVSGGWVAEIDVDVVGMAGAPADSYLQRWKRETEDDLRAP